jgi:hypothetical protein
MSQIAKPAADRRRFPVVYAFYLVEAIAISIIFGTLRGWVGVAIGAAFLLLLGAFLATVGRRVSRLTVGEVGNTRIETKAGSGSGLSRKVGMTAFGICAAALILGVILQAIELLQQYVASGSSEDLDWMPLIRALSISLLCLFNLSLTLGNRWRRLLFTEQGLFQVFDPNRLWASDRDLDEPNSPLRAIRLYDWDRVTGFHWSNQAGSRTLHLNVRQPGISVPQLVTFNFPSLSDADRRRIDDLLQNRITPAAPPEADRSLTTSTAG